MSRIYLSLGSNQAPGSHLRAAIQALQQQFGEVKISPAYRNAAVGFVGHPFVNLAVRLDTDWPLAELRAWLHALEDREGRRRDVPKYSDRSLDIDIVFVEQQIIDADGLRIPRPEWKLAFVLKPMMDLDPDFREPVSGESLSELWRHSPLADTELERVELAVLD